MFPAPKKPVLTESLKQFRDRFPKVRPYGFCPGPSDQDLEIISWPWDEGGAIYVNARMPGDASTMQTYRVVEGILYHLADGDCPVSLYAD